MCVFVCCVRMCVCMCVHVCQSVLLTSVGGTYLLLIVYPIN